MPALLLITALGLSMGTVPQPASAGPGRLPSPTGPSSIGRVTLLWSDRTRIEPLDPDHNARQLMVDIWYPADSGTGAAAEYLNVEAYERALGPDGLRKQLGDGYDSVKSGVRTHAVAGAPFAHSIKRSPVLIFSPGGGMVREVYVAQLEDLASHGYVVAAISHTYDAIAAIFPGGRAIVYSSQRWPATPSFEGESNLNQLEWHADDIRFVLDQLTQSNEPGSSLPFAGRLDLARVGAFGHSFGGIAAAHACQKDRRIKACLNQDGAVAMRPFYPDARGWGMDQPFLLLERSPNSDPPSDRELEEMKVTRERANEIIARLQATRDRLLRSTGTGSYQVLLQRDITSHMDFTDLPLLGAHDQAGAETRTRVLAVIQSYTRAFFDKYLRAMKAPLLDGKGADPLVQKVHRFPPVRRSDDHRRRLREKS